MPHVGKFRSGGQHFVPRCDLGETDRNTTAWSLALAHRRGGLRAMKQDLITYHVDFCVMMPPRIGPSTPAAVYDTPM